MADVYEMMMHLGVRGGALSDLLLIAGRLTSLNNLVNDINNNMGRWGKAVIGFGAILGGVAVLGAMEKLLLTAKDFSAEMVKLQGLGGDMKAVIESGEFKTKAFDIAKTTGLKVEDVAKIAGFANSILDTKNTMNALEALSMFASIQKDSTGHSVAAGDQGKALQNVIRAGMITGRITDPKTGDIDMIRLEKFLDEFQRLKSGTHGAFNEDVLLGMAKQGGGYLRGLNTEGMEAMAIMSQSLGGPRTGTAFLGIYEQLARGQMTAKTAYGMQEAGLLRPQDYDIGKGGTVTLDKAVSQHLTKLFGSNPLDLAKLIRENLIKQGITDPQEQMRITANAFGRQTTRRFAAEEIADYNQMIGESKRLGQGASVKQMFDAKMAHDIQFNIDRMHNALHNLLVSIADPQSDNFIKILQGITSALNSMQDAVRGMDPNTIRFIGLGIAALGAALIGTGIVAVIAAIGPFGWLIAAFVALAATNWDSIKKIWDFILMMGNILKKIDEWSQIKIPSWMQWNRTPPVVAPPELLPKKQSFYDTTPSGVPSIIPASFNPGEKKQILQPIQLDLNVDGRTLAQCVSEILEDLYQHPAGAPSSNGWNKFRPAGQYSDT